MEGSSSSAHECVSIARIKQTERKTNPNFKGDNKTGTIKHTIDGDQTSFAKVYTPDKNNMSVYTESLQSITSRVLEGRNACLCAIGTSTSGNDELMFALDDEEGVAVTAIKTIFDLMDNKNHRHCCTLSMCQVGSDLVVDLLNPSQEASMEVKGNRQGFRIENQAFLSCTNAKETIEFVNQGMRVHQSLLKQIHVNVRPQVIIDIRIETQSTSALDKILSGSIKFVLIETGDSSIMVDNGLRAIGEVINLLSAGIEDTSTVPFHSSTLTKLLSNELGGNCETVFIATVDPFGEVKSTKNSLMLVSKGAKIKNSPAVNRSMLASEIAVLRKEIRAARSKMQLSNPGKFLHDIDRRDLAAFQDKLGQLEHLKSQTWETKRQQAVRWRAERKENLRKLGLLHVLQEKIQVDEKLTDRYSKLKKDVVESLVKIQTYQVQMEKEITKKKKMDESKNADITAADAKIAKYIKTQTVEKRKFLNLSDSLRKVLTTVVEEEEKQRKTFLMSAEQLQVHQANVEYNLLRMNYENLDISELRENMKKKRDCLSEHSKADESIKQLIKDRFDAERKSIQRKWERDQLREMLVENRYRYEAYLQRSELHMLDVFKQYREHFESQKREMEDRYRKMLKDAIQDAVHLQKKNLELQAQINHLQQMLPDKYKRL